MAGSRGWTAVPPPAMLRSMKKPSRMEESLRESEARLRAVFNTVVDGIITINERGIIDSFNPSAERMFNYTAREVIGKSVNILMPAPFSYEHDEYIRRYLRTGRARIIGYGREVVARRKDGSLFPMDLAVSEVKLGRRRLFTGICRDVTERRSMEAAMASISERERQRLGQDLHDGVGQQLAGLNLLAKGLQNRLVASAPSMAPAAAEIVDLANQVLDKVRRQSHGLYPIELEKRGLATALLSLAADARHLYGIDCTAESPRRMPRLSTVTALHLYRIAQEALHNAVKHGHPTTVRIALERNDGLLVLSVEDDGHGLTAAKPRRRGMGLVIMKHRANTIGGQFDIRPRPGGGTLVKCMLPLAMAAAPGGSRRH